MEKADTYRTRDVLLAGIGYLIAGSLALYCKVWHRAHDWEDLGEDYPEDHRYECTRCPATKS